jgi:hypothetical protein
MTFLRIFSKTCGERLIGRRRCRLWSEQNLIGGFLGAAQRDWFYSAHSLLSSRDSAELCWRDPSGPGQFLWESDTPELGRGGLDLWHFDGMLNRSGFDAGFVVEAPPAGTPACVHSRQPRIRRPSDCRERVVVNGPVSEASSAPKAKMPLCTGSISG